MSTSRRGFLQIGAVSAVGLTLDALLRARDADAGAPVKAKSVIFVRLTGGPGHLDTFDPKPEARSEVRGEFGAIATKSGDRLSEHLPKLAACSDKFALVRAVTHNLGEHALAQTLTSTGNRPDATLVYPSLGAIAAKEIPGRPDMPSSVAIPGVEGAGFLGVQYAPFATGGDPARSSFVVAGLGPRGLTEARLRRRRDLAALFDRGPEAGAAPSLAIDRFQAEALAMVTSERARAAFDLRGEPDAHRDAYGRTSLGQSLLLARRLVEAGVRFVTVATPNAWDLHGAAFDPLKGTLLPALDQALSSLLLDLAASGRLAETAVWVTGEFGRTPVVNARGGRDHWPNVYTCLFAGGGSPGGLVLGASDAEGAAPRDRAVRPQDIAATLLALLGVDATRRNTTSVGRVVPVLHEGEPIRELLG
ncbi:MAG TPA: DUF1501 domain-containing protein [Byssovorax sp.]